MPSVSSFDPTGYPFASLVISVILTLNVSFFLATSYRHRSAIGYSGLLAALVAVIANILSLLTPRISYMGPIISALYSSFTYLTILYAFERLSRNGIHKASQSIARFGYFWTLVTIITGLSLTIVIAKSINDPDNLSEDTANLTIFLLVSSWVFIIITWVLFGLLYHKLSKQSYRSMIAFATLVTIEAIFVLIFLFTSIHGVAGLVIILIFIKLPIAAAIMIAVVYGPYWIKDSEGDARNESDYNDIESSAQVEEY